MGRITKYTTKELLNIKEEKETFISHWLHRGDLMFLKAQKKVGKSIFAQCLAHCCSSGDEFLGEYKVVRPLKVAYLFSEGAIVDWKDRVKIQGLIQKYIDLTFLLILFPSVLSSLLLSLLMENTQWKDEVRDPKSILKYLKLKHPYLCLSHLLIERIRAY